jgi:signal transduction histidine kinase/HPt (histidine-containing phosphotransfer) domain-containing protein
MSAVWRDRAIRGELMLRARILAAALDRDDLLQHRNTPDDIPEAWFRRTKERLQAARSADPALSYVYLLERTQTGLRFPNDDDAYELLAEQPPGMLYDDAPAEMVVAIDNGLSFALGPYTDRWGEFLSAGAPIALSGGRSMHAVMDLGADEWHNQLMLWRAWPMALGAAAAAVVLLFWSRGQALERARRAAAAEAEANRAKDLYLSTVSHDLRTPLGGIIGLTGLIADTDLTSEQREHVPLAHDSAQQLLGLINELLDYARIEAGRLELDATHCRVREVVEDAVALLAPIAERKGIGLDAIIDRGVPESLLGDPDRLRQIVHNLIGNAIKFTDEGQVVVRLAARPESGRVVVELSVEDSGIGMDAATIGRLFQPFAQAGDAARRRGGTGLGLCIAQRIAEAMGGSITVTSVLGRGSVFIAAVRLDADPSPPETDHGLPAIRRGGRVCLDLPEGPLRASLIEQLAALGMAPEAGAWDGQAPVPAAVLVAAGSSGTRIEAGGQTVPVILVGTRNAGGTQVVAVRRQPLLLRPVRRTALARALRLAWGDQQASASRRRAATSPPVESEDYEPGTVASAPAAAPADPATAARVARPAREAMGALGDAVRTGLQAVCDALEAGDLQTVARAAKGLRAGAEPLGFEDLAKLCSKLEAVANQGDAIAARRVVAELVAIREDLRVRIRRRASDDSSR